MASRWCVEDIGFTFERSLIVYFRSIGSDLLRLTVTLGPTLSMLIVDFAVCWTRPLQFP